MLENYPLTANRKSLYFMSLVLSGVQPTGNLHLGNYLGAIRNWVALQETHTCLYMLADLHAITLPIEPAKLRRAIRETAAAYIACGIDPKKHIIFPQSSVSAHAELAWVFSCHTPLGWLNRMTQFKDKAGKNKDRAALGLYSYPVLMAADILVYKATHVPVGEDQKQHLELSRDIAGAFNRAYPNAGQSEDGTEGGVFPLPEPLILGEATRVMSLRDGTKKMSKSDESDASRIHLLDDNETIAKKIRKAKSDMVENMVEDLENRPEALNLVTLYAAVTNRKRAEVLAEIQHDNFASFKAKLADAMVAHLEPIRAKMAVLLEDETSLDGILEDGAWRANAIAKPVMQEVYERIGFPKYA